MNNKNLIIGIIILMLAFVVWKYIFKKNVTAETAAINAGLASVETKAGYQQAVANSLMDSATPIAVNSAEVAGAVDALIPIVDETGKQVNTPNVYGQYIGGTPVSNFVPLSDWSVTAKTMIASSGITYSLPGGIMGVTSELQYIPAGATILN